MQFSNDLRPYLWAWTALKYYKEVTCGRQLDEINAKYQQYDPQHQECLKKLMNSPGFELLSFYVITRIYAFR